MGAYTTVCTHKRCTFRRCVFLYFFFELLASNDETLSGTNSEGTSSGNPPVDLNDVTGPIRSF